ncbi:MAG: hypothetical protein JNM86_14120 [Phycisphaerae bacterium]|nr:hypothetical protein [Phycisphaerae bacterium]
MKLVSIVTALLAGQAVAGFVPVSRESYLKSKGYTRVFDPPQYDSWDVTQTCATFGYWAVTGRGFEMSYHTSTAWANRAGFIGEARLSGHSGHSGSASSNDQIGHRYVFDVPVPMKVRVWGSSSAAKLTSEAGFVLLGSSLTAGGTELTLQPSRYTLADTFTDGHGFSNFQIKVMCPADVDNNAAVDDADFVLFTQSYDFFSCSDPAAPAGCPADLNGDQRVDDDDFVIFALAYNELVCP